MHVTPTNAYVKHGDRSRHDELLGFKTSSAGRGHNDCREGTAGRIELNSVAWHAHLGARQPVECMHTPALASLRPMTLLLRHGLRDTGDASSPLQKNGRDVEVRCVPHRTGLYREAWAVEAPSCAEGGVAWGHGAVRVPSAQAAWQLRDLTAAHGPWRPAQGSGCIAMGRREGFRCLRLGHAPHGRKGTPRGGLMQAWAPGRCRLGVDLPERRSRRAGPCCPLSHMEVGMPPYTEVTRRTAPGQGRQQPVRTLPEGQRCLMPCGCCCPGVCHRVPVAASSHGMPIVLPHARARIHPEGNGLSVAHIEASYSVAHIRCRYALPMLQGGALRYAMPCPCCPCCKVAAVPADN